MRVKLQPVQHVEAYMLPGFVMALNSRLLPLGSLKNMVHCSPGWPSKRRCGFMMNFTPFEASREASKWKFSTVRQTPKCGTGTSSPSGPHGGDHA